MSVIDDPTPKASKRKKPVRFARLDGRPAPLARGRHAGRPADAEREVITVAVSRRLGFRPTEYAALLGVSTPHVWRGIKSGKIETVTINGVEVIPRSFVIKQGLISKDDDI